jgi:hypothetical protein
VVCKCMEVVGLIPGSTFFFGKKTLATEQIILLRK